MNNDIPYDYNHIKPQPVAGSRNLQNDFLFQADRSRNEEQHLEKKDSRDCFNAMGHAQVKMDGSIPLSIRKSVEDFLDNPELIQMQTDFCDDLIQKGYTLEDATEKTDMVFKALKNEALYS